MKITNEQLRRIIKEEIEAVFQEGGGIDGQYERRPFAATDGPMSMEFGKDTGNLVLINFGIKEGLPQDYVVIELSKIENNFREEIVSQTKSPQVLKYHMGAYKSNMIEAPSPFMTEDAYKSGLVPELVKKLGPDWDALLDKDLLYKRLTKRQIYTGGGNGALASIEQFIKGHPLEAHIRADQTTPGNRVTVDDPTME